jgi:acyl carrier protein
MTQDPLKDAIRTYIANEYAEDPDEAIADTTPLISGGIVDSFSMISLKCFLERTYSIAIPDGLATAESFDSVEKIAAVVRKLKPGA